MSLFSLFKPKQGQRIPVRRGKALLAHHKKEIAEMRAIVGLPRRYWNALYLQALHNLADFAQQLPASEAHHHSGRGGLLAHTIETALNALRLRRGKLLPPNADAETVTRLKDVWTYAVFTGAITHDLGKPITDMAVELYDKKGTKLGLWSPFQGPMSRNHLGRSYRVRYRRQRRYTSHERASALYVHHIIPETGIEWIATDSELFYHWTNILTGHSEDSGIIGSIIHEADKLSVAANLAGDQVSVSAATTGPNRKPLHQRILTSLRHEIDRGTLPLNRDGAAGWVADGMLWMVVKRTLDQVRDAMTQEGQTGIPARNDRIMDELQQYGILVPNGDKAVWKCQVFAPDWPKAHELTLICFPLDKVWASDDAMPDPFSGSITPLGTEPNPSGSGAANSNAPGTDQEPPAQNESAAALDTPSSSRTAATSTEAASSSDSPPPTSNPPTDAPAIEPPTIDFGSLAATGNETAAAAIVESDHAGSADQDDKPKPDDQPQPAPVSETPTPDATGSKGRSGKPDETGIEAGQAFLNWLRDGLHERRFAVNDVHAKIHMTKDGLFLVSPAIFKQYDQKRWSYVQKRFTKLRVHEKSPNGTNIHEYVASGAKKRSIIKGFLIVDTDSVFHGIELPKVNHALSRLDAR